MKRLACIFVTLAVSLLPSAAGSTVLASSAAAGETVFMLSDAEIPSAEGSAEETVEEGNLNAPKSRTAAADTAKAVRRDINQAILRHTSPVLNLGREEISSHNAGTSLFMEKASLTSAKAGFDYQDAEQDYLPQNGSGLVQGSFEAKTIILGNDGSAVDAGASYVRGVKRNVLWNSTSDFELLYPTIMADSVGGDLQKEQYKFYGGWTGKVGGRGHIGVRGSYRALHEFRTVDPRPRNVTSDLGVTLSGGLLAADHVFGLNLGGRIYKQSQDVEFYNPRGANTSEIHFTGLGSSFARFNSAGDFTASQYNGYGFETAVTVIPQDTDGWLGLLSYSSLGIECLLTSLNDVPITDLWIQTAELKAGYRDFSGGFRWSLFGGASYELRQNTEYIIEQSSGGQYRSVGDLTMYRSRILTARVEGAAEKDLARGTVFARPEVEYMRFSSEYEYPARSMDFSTLTAAALAGYRRSGEKWLIDLGIMAGWQHGASGSLSIPSEYTDPKVEAHYHDMYGKLSSSRFIFGSSGRIQRKAGKRLTVYLEEDLRFRTSGDYGLGNGVSLALGLVF